MVLPASRRIPRVLRYSGAGSASDLFVYGAFTLSGGAFQLSSTKVSRPLCRSTTPVSKPTGLASFPFARRYLGNHCCFLFLRVLRCFSSPGSLYMAMDSPYSDWSFSSRVSPFRNLRVNEYLLLTAAYRSLSRLSSALSAKASTLCSFLLDQSTDSSVTIDM